MKKRKFTLIELMVVVAIIAILAGIALPLLFSARERYKKMKQAKTDACSRLAKEEEAYAIQPESIYNLPKTENADIKLKLKANSFVSNFKVYTMFDVNFSGDFVFTGSSKQKQNVQIFFPFPSGTTQASNVLLEVLDKSGHYTEPKDANYSLAGIRWFHKLSNIDELAVRVTYTAQGYDRYIYQGPGASQAKNLTIDMELAGISSEFIPPSALQPTHKKNGHLIWKFNNLITNRQIEVKLPGDKSPIGRIILLLRLTGLAVFLFGLGFMYMNDLEDPNRLKDFRWGHFLLLALIYSLFFVIFTAFNMGAGMSVALSTLLSVFLSLPLLMVHVGRYLGFKFAIYKILPLALFTLTIVINGVYGGSEIMFIYIGLLVIAMAFFTITFKNWSEKRKEYKQQKQDEFDEVCRENQVKFDEQQQQIEKQKECENNLKKLAASANKLNETYKTVSIYEYKAKLLLEEESSEAETTIREKINKHLTQISELKQRFHTIQAELSEMHAKQDNYSIEKYTDLDERLRQNRVNLEQLSCRLQVENNKLKVEREKQKTATEKLGNTIHCLVCGYKHDLAKYCPNCGVPSSQKITCKNCGQIYMLPIPLLSKEKLETSIHCHFCGEPQALSAIPKDNYEPEKSMPIVKGL